MATATRQSQPRGRRSVPTDPESIPKRSLARSRAGRRALIVALAVFAAAGMSGYLGPKTATTTARDDGYSIAVTYPEITRPGLPIRWEYTIKHPGGFDGPVSLVTTFDYLHLFDLTNIEPAPVESTATAEDVVFRFSPPDGDVLRVSMDATSESGFHEVPRTLTRVLVGGSNVVSVEFDTKVVP